MSKTYKCDLCEQEFKSKRILEQHENKKNKCNIVTDFQCDKCNKYFKYKKNLKEHTEKDICKNTQIILLDENKTSEGIHDTESLAILIKSKIDDSKKMELINKYYNIEISDLQTIFNSELTLEQKVLLINDFKNNISKTGTNINNNNINNGTIHNTNTTNNIQINNFGNETIEYLDNEYFKDLIMNNHIQTAYMKLIEDTYLHKDHPENRTVKIDNLNNKYAFVFENGKWKGILKYELKELLHNKNNRLLKIHYKKLREFLDAAKRSSINVFFSRQYDSDPHLKLMNDQMVLLFYEAKNKNEI
jgi:hypothetical protein